MNGPNNKKKSLSANDKSEKEKESKHSSPLQNFSLDHNIQRRRTEKVEGNSVNEQTERSGLRQCVCVHFFRLSFSCWFWSTLDEPRTQIHTEDFEERPPKLISTKSHYHIKLLAEFVHRTVPHTHTIRFNFDKIFQAKICGRDSTTLFISLNW